MQIIESISEAFSTQPRTMSVCENYDTYYDKEKACKEIRLETIEIGKKCGDPVQELYYVGYNFQYDKIFQYIANTVNVHYKRSE